MLHLLIGGGIFVVTLAAIMFRPYRSDEALSAVIGAILMLIAGFVSLNEIARVILGEWNTFGFFLGLVTISAVAEEAGVFESLANAAARWGKGKAQRLYVAVFAVGVVISVFLTNDATALILTPVIYALVTRLRLPVLPFMFACTFIADTASFVLPVSNPINIIVLNTFGSSLGTFLHYLLLPSILAISLNVILFALLFRRDLTLDCDTHASVAGAKDKRLLAICSAVLGLIAASYVIGLVLNLPLSFIALGGAVLMIVAATARRRFSPKLIARKISWPIFAFVGGMLVVVKAVDNLGLTAAFGNGLVQAAGGKSFWEVLLVTGGTALGANLINNVPMSLVMVSALHGVNHATSSYHSLPFAVMFGADLGPNLTTVGSLATMLWLLILRRRGLEVSTLQYFKLGLMFVPVVIVLGSVLIWAQL